MTHHLTYPPGLLRQIWSCQSSQIVYPQSLVTVICTDSRHIPLPEQSLFFALKGSHSHGNIHIQEAIQKGVKNIVTDDENYVKDVKVNFFIVRDTLAALQQLAQYHRNQFTHVPVLGITGSHGKTIVKEWLSQLMPDIHVIKSPKSYNSQIGVALSVWEMSDEDELAIFEAGISQTGEMETLEKMIQPHTGIFTTLGDAHDSGFSDTLQKLQEKLRLFLHSDVIVFEEDNELVANTIKQLYPHKILHSWGYSAHATLLKVLEIERKDNRSELTLHSGHQTFSIRAPFSDEASLHNLLTCVATLLSLGKRPESFIPLIPELKNLPMRLEMKNGIHGSLLINDTYNADLYSLRIALEFLSQQAGIRDKVLIISDLVQLGLDAETLAQKVAYLAELYGISFLMGIGQHMSILEKYLSPFILFHKEENTEDLLKYLNTWDSHNKAILIKGARQYNLEKIFEKLSDKSHSTTLEIDLKSVEHNLKLYKEHLSPSTQIIAVIKASAYGTGSEDLALLLQNKGVDYLAVAFSDEAVRLRKAGVSIPIMILNPETGSLQNMIKYDLEPTIYSLEQLSEILHYMRREKLCIKVHLKVDTGMHRLGFIREDIEALCEILETCTENIIINSIFSHLTSSENENHDDWTLQQVNLFENLFSAISSVLDYKVRKHILNSAGIVRFPQYHFDCVRLGLGLYGISSLPEFEGVERVHTLSASVIQIKPIKRGESVGYNRSGIPHRNAHIAMINIGYADGLMRVAGMGRFSVSINGKEYPIIGQVCMDLTMIDIGHDHDSVQVGDKVIIFGKEKPIEHLSEVCNTIPYEILSRISERVKRVYTRS